MKQQDRQMIAKEIGKAQASLVRARQMAKLGDDLRLAKRLDEQLEQLGGHILELNEPAKAKAKPPELFVLS